MEKIEFYLNETSEKEEFFVLEQTKINGSEYILVTDTEDEDGECLILKEVGRDGDETIYDVLEEETELLAVSKVFEELLEDVDIEM